MFIINKKGWAFQPLFGTDLPSFLFEQINDKLLNELKDSMSEDIKFGATY